jgi:hypothetical protein
MNPLIQCKTRILPLLIAGVLACFGLLPKAQAIIIDGSRPVGITLGQTARVSILNTGDRAIIIEGSKFLDNDGNVVATFRGTIDPGKTMSFDLDRDSFIREENRVEIHVVLEGPQPHLKGALISLEVFNNADGRTTIFIGDPGI